MLLFEMPMTEAAASLGVSTTIVKRLCRRHRIPRSAFLFAQFQKGEVHFAVTVCVCILSLYRLFLPYRWPYRKLMALDKQINRVKRKMSATVTSLEDDYKEGTLNEAIWKTTNGSKACSISLELEALCFERQRIAKGCFDPDPSKQLDPDSSKLLQKELMKDLIQCPTQPIQGHGIKQYWGREISKPAKLVPAQPQEQGSLSLQIVSPHQHSCLANSPSVLVKDSLQLSPLAFDSAMRPFFTAPAHGGLLDIHTPRQSEMHLTEDAIWNSGHNKQVEVNGNIAPNFCNPTNVSLSQNVNDPSAREGISTAAVHSQNNAAMNGGNVLQHAQIKSRGTGVEGLNVQTPLAPVNTEDLISPFGMAGVNRLVSSPFLLLNGSTTWISPTNESVVATPQVNRKHHFELLSTTYDAASGGGGGSVNDCNPAFSGNVDMITTGIVSDGMSNGAASEVQPWNLSSVASPSFQNIFLFSPLQMGYEKFV